MRRKLMASVLLASMAFTLSVYADDDRTPDEYNPNARYESPLTQQQPVVVNDGPGRKQDEAVRFEEAAGCIAQRAASGNSAGEKKAAKEAAAVLQAEQEADAVLRNTDENFEPAVEQKTPGHEYQALRQIAVQDPESNTMSDKQPEAKKQESISQTNVKQSTEKHQDSKKQREKAVQPLIITGDDARYANDSGDFVIEGNVRMEQGETRLSSSRAVGNAKTGDVWLLTGGTLQEPSNTIQVQWAHYNFNNKTGELRYLEGVSQPGRTDDKKDLYRAPHAIVEDGKMIIDQGGEYTRCPAVLHPPCVSVKAKTITIIPNDKIVARNVQVFARGKLLYSRNVWIHSLKEGASQIGPRFGWKSDKGFYVALDYELPIGNPQVNNPTKAYMRQVYYTKAKYKPFYGIRHDEHDFYLRLHDGYVYDSDDDRIDEGIWLHKKMDWGIFLKPHRIVKGLPLTYDGHITHGLWKYTNANWSSRHTEKVIRLRHDRFYPFGGRKLYMDLMVGRKWVNESNAATPDTVRFGKNLHTNIYRGTLGYRFSDKLNIWETYHNEHKTSYNFSLGQPSYNRGWVTGISWIPDKHNTFTIANIHNSDSGSPTHGNYSTVFSWNHTFCCEVLTVIYERKHYNGDHSFSVKFDITNW